MKFGLAIVPLLTTFATLVSANDCDESICIAGGKACTGREGECCEGLGCFGFNFYKTCQAAPSCLAEWFDCSIGIPCCADFTCVETPSKKFECQRPQPGTRSVDFTSGFLVADPLPPPQPPAKNLKTTIRTGNRMLRACLSGDPHITTFDGFQWDCQGHGEFVMAKSLITQREIQGRFKQFGNRGGVSIARGFVIQDEGDTPKVQITSPETRSGFAQEFGSSRCRLQLFVDNKQEDLFNFENDKVRVERLSNGSTIRVSYKDSGLRVELRVGGGTNCMMNICLSMPESNDQLVGLLGSPDREISNDWMDKSGTVVAGRTRRGKAAYDYCVQNWCIRDEKESLFFYNQIGANFPHFSRCDLPHNGKVVEQLLHEITPEIEALCGTRLSCLEDAVFGGIEMARDALLMQATLSQTSVAEGVTAQLQGAVTISSVKAMDWRGVLVFGRLFNQECR